MVGQLIRLKAKMVWNTMVKQTLVLVLSIIGILYFGGVGAFVYVGLTMSAQSAIAPSMSFYLTLIGPVVFIGWILLPVLFGALDNTLAPDRLSPYVGPTRRLGVGLVAAGGVGFGGALSTMVLLMPAWFNAWRGVPLHALGSLAADPELAGRLAQQGEREAAERFSVAGYRAAMTRIVDELLER